MFDATTRNAIEQELFCAENARLTGNEGKARVCARRAAGIAVRAYFKAIGIAFSDPSAYALLSRLLQLETTPKPVKEITSRLLIRVNPNYSLPAGYDLIEDARKLTAWAAENINGEKA